MMKDHEIREMVNRLRDIAVEFHDSEQLRERIAREIRQLKPEGKDNTSWMTPHWMTPYSLSVQGIWRHRFVITFEGDVILELSNESLAKTTVGALNEAYNLGRMQERLYTTIREDETKSYFPITIEMVSDGERVIAYSPEDLPSGAPFIVVETATDV